MKKTTDFRNYQSSSSIIEKIKENYYKMRTKQTLSHVHTLEKKYLVFNKHLNIWDVLESLNNFVDISDPDINLPNLHHLFQTAEAIRKDGHPDWFQLVGLIHDMGKIIYRWGNDNDGTSIKEQWSIVGDTFLVGCKLPDTCVYPEFNQDNPDMSNPKYNTPIGIYTPNCGLSNTKISFGHDEYLFQMLKYNEATIPVEGMYMIRYHSLYPWHKENEYQEICDNKDFEMLPWVKLFNKYDLYTKCETQYSIEELKDYYTPIIKKYLNKLELYF